MVMPSVIDLINNLSSCEVEDEKLYLPSDLTMLEHSILKVDNLVTIEVKLREGEVYDSIKAVQNVAKTFSITHAAKNANEQGTNRATRATQLLHKIEIEWDCCINDYMRARQALIELRGAKPEELPPRQLGDSRCTDGQLYTITFRADKGGESGEEADVGGSDAKFAAILMDSINSFKRANPFENLHLPGKYDSSFNLSQNQILSPMTSPPSTSLHPSVPFPSSSSNPSVYASHSQISQRSCPQKPTTQSPKVHRDPYVDLPTENTLVAPAISAWLDINKTIC
ncbi:hypothetical protein GYMLUDRAFT_244018 [Collybiopsis luxurians FD-317 M1]|uniref:Uncharacterized protein n=1 Tax=Collybiopsis luxurians FD-317 M1 TaxID=944289 RepID=A0A0D0BAV6_9AGAR|nr:hypothetical protein GYMLUDRAFT_244018 [Collybiopsis luxurians FD-317 M1]